MSTVSHPIPDGQLRPAIGASHRTNALLPSPCIQNHAANLHVMADGELLCAWFGGTQEGIPDISIYLSRLAPDGDYWSTPEKVSDDPTRSEQNPVLFDAGDNQLWLLYTAQQSGHQDTAIVRRRISHDGGHHWGPIDTLFERSGTFVRQPPVIIDNGDWVCPVFYCRKQPGERWIGNDDISAVLVSSDKGQSWQEYEVPHSAGCVHMNIVPLKTGGVLALYRSRWADYIYKSHSSDGRHWSAPVATQLPNNNSSIQCISLTNGDLALVYNHINAEGVTERRTSLYDDIEDSEDHGELINQPARHGKSAFWGVPRAPMTLAISHDNGESWPWRQDLETGDGYCMTNNSANRENREYSYPTIAEDPNNGLHIAFTRFRQCIQYTHFVLDTHA